jgi:hypothetical protein
MTVEQTAHDVAPVASSMTPLELVHGGASTLSPGGSLRYDATVCGDWSTGRLSPRCSSPTRPTSDPAASTLPRSCRGDT